MPLKIWKVVSKIYLISLLPTSVFAQVEVDTISKRLEEVIVSVPEATASLSVRNNGTFVWNTEQLNMLPQILGNSDPVRYTQMLPGVQTNSELDAGLHIQGSDNTHNLYSIQGIPIYNVAHLLGLFSVFNGSHYSNLTLRKTANEASVPSRLGGVLDMEHSRHPEDSISGVLSVGPMSSQGTFRMPITNKSSLVLSARASYLNLLYSKWLEQDDMGMKYSFYDTNMTWQWEPNERNRVWLDMYHGRDNVRMDVEDYRAGIKQKWGNTMLAIHWDGHCRKGVQWNNSVYVTRYDGQFELSQGDYLFSLPSDITDVGAKSETKYKNWRAGAELVRHNILPQNPKSEGLFVGNLHSQERYKTQEFSLWSDYCVPLSSQWNFATGVRTSAYVDFRRRPHLAADPSVRLNYRHGIWSGELCYSLRHQYLFLTGSSSMGLPTEFWTSIGEDLPAQWGQGVTWSGAVNLLDGQLRIAAEAYYKRLYNQAEYDGDMMKFLSSEYCLNDNLLHGDGYNYGINVMFQKTSGAFSGWVSYSYGRARRRFEEDGFARFYSSNHERPHEINVLATYQVGRRWKLSGTYIYASGTPFTAPDNFYIMNGMLLCQYGEHNAHRLRHYNRLDISVNYLFPMRHHCKSGINLSLYNASMQKNDLTCRLKVHEGRYLYSHFCLVTFILPSINYFLNF